MQIYDECAYVLDRDFTILDLLKIDCYKGTLETRTQAADVSENQIVPYLEKSSKETEGRGKRNRLTIGKETWEDTANDNTETEDISLETILLIIEYLS